MIDVDELKRFALPHAPGQGIAARRCRELLPRIRTDDRGLPGSWVWEWRRAGELLERRGRLLDACRHYNMARFPYVNGTARHYALERSLSAFDRWRQANTDIQYLHLDLPGGQVRCWTSGLSTTDRKPLLLIMDGILTTKERWAPLLTDVRRLGMAGVVTEMPGVGENTLRYDKDSWRMLSAILDTIGGRADVGQTYVMALSIGGHMALRCAVGDARIRGVITTGAPVSNFFTDAAWHHTLPRLALDTLAHLTGTTAETITGQLRDWALTHRELADLDIPICYMASRRDYIVPHSETSYLQHHVRDLHLLENNDVYGSPRHLAETRLWAALSVLRMRGVRSLRRAAVGSLWRTLRARHLIAGPGSEAQ